MRRNLKIKNLASQMIFKASGQNYIWKKISTPISYLTQPFYIQMLLAAEISPYIIFKKMFFFKFHDSQKKY